MRVATRTGVALLAAAAALVLSACSSGAGDAAGKQDADGQGDGATKTVETAFGKVEMPTKPKSVVALEGAIGPLLSAGITPKATASGDNPDGLLPEEFEKVKDLPAVLGSDGWEYEKIAAQKPDLLIGTVRAGKDEKISPQAQEEYKRLKGIAPTVMILAEGATHAKDASLQISEIVGSGDKAKQAKEEYVKKIDHIKGTYDDKLKEYTFAPIDHFEGNVSVYTRISWLGGIITDMGGKLDPVSAGITDRNGTDLSTEQLTKLSDKSIILTEMGLDGKPGAGAAELAGVPTYQQLPSVKAGHAFGVKYFFPDRYETANIVLDQLEDILKKV
ncbi:ABC transporter substrate-binding protein [Brevibacterium gallinarum]|uniref:ABC transporter substrate-binding protein n=1 Tax=Brevibacterium gallinarum TaxID=2762220 RepID=A0ABR8WSN6_9MICO|nr:ABC transporter substrate-binding protein [Brevibacterium gallinarum]MBD8019902.1 ABC transporter substrate-binding protein [Brevibacterium gallinarum]